MRMVWLAGLLVVGSVAAAAGQGMAPSERFPLQDGGLVIRQHAEASKPFTVAGERGLVVGQQDGTFEAWVLPVKLLSHFQIRAEVEGYSVPIELNPSASEIEVFPDHTTITYAHIAFTVRQTMFAPSGTEAGAADGTGAVVLFQIEAIRPMELTFSFTPEVRPMWPERGEGVPSAEWVARGESGFYVLHTDFNDLAAAVAMPGARSGVLAPYQERPQIHPVELRLHYDPKRDKDRFFPLLMAVGRTPDTAATGTLESRLRALDGGLKEVYAGHLAAYAKQMAAATAIETPEVDLNDDLAWAEVSIEQLRAREARTGKVGLVAGYYSSGDSARPGFGWFFGRDTLYTLYAVNSFGDFALSRTAMDFLLAQQRADGKMMHEYSQTAADLDWKALPYLYAAADSTPLFLCAMLDYVRASGDVAYLKEHREAVERAWHFEVTHDTDGDGIYDNSQGTGWVESWPPGMPHQEIYLALLDQQASAATASLAGMLGNKELEETARDRASELAKKIETEYYEPELKAYAFSRGSDGKLDRSATVYPAVAWWNAGAPVLTHAEESFGRWASHDFSTDWGLRDVAESDPLYDPISYHQGSVWPLFTGWAALAEYRTGRSLAGYMHLRENADLTTAQDLGAATELLSGAFYEPFGRSTSHQLWSSAMVVTPLLRGLFGIEVDAPGRTIRLDPHLPASWDRAAVRRLHVGETTVDLEFHRQGQRLEVRMRTIDGRSVRLLSAAKGAGSEEGGAVLVLPLPAVEVGVADRPALPGDRTKGMKVLSQTVTGRTIKLELEAPAGAMGELQIRRNASAVTVKVEGGQLNGAGDAANGKAAGVTAAGMQRLTVTFPPGTGYQARTVTLRW